MQTKPSELPAAVDSEAVNPTPIAAEPDDGSVQQLGGPNQNRPRRRGK